MKRRTLAPLLAVLALAAQVRAQTVSAEADFTGGYSNEHVAAAAVQLRLFGEATGGIQYFAEAAWGRRYFSEEEESDHTTDAFGAAYPYGNRVQVIEAYGERLFRPGGTALFGARFGRFRTPFGIYGRSDHGYTGFLRAPLIRYDRYFALSNNYLEHGVHVTGGIPQLFVEASLGTPHDVGTAIRRDGTDSSLRMQGYYRTLIVGVSHSRSNPYLPATFARGRSVFSGVDFRWMDHGIQARGEWLTGQPFDGVTTTGWYVDVMAHRQQMGSVTAVARFERLDYNAPSPRARFARRVIAGARVRLPGPITAQVNVMHQTGDLPGEYGNAVDVSVTYSVRYR